MALTAQQSQQLYNTPAYTGWDEASARADFQATGGAGKIANTQPTPQQLTPPPTGQPNEPRSAQDLISMGFYGYRGWGDNEAILDYRATGGQGKGGSGGAETGTAGGGIAGLAGGFSVTPTIDLPSIYSSLYQNSGIQDKEARLNDIETKYLEARNKTSDNPFLSASMIDQRLKRLEGKYEKETASLRNEIATKKADIETQLNLQTKQFDINSQSARDALDYFNTLLSAGALDNASGEDIANITRATGITSSMIQSAISSRNKKDVETQLITSTADSGLVTATLINTQTGEVIKQSSLGNIGNQQTGGGLSVSQQAESDRQENLNNLQADVQSGVILSQLVGYYGRVLDVEDIYRIYNIYSPHGQAVESIEDVKSGQFINRG